MHILLKSNSRTKTETVSLGTWTQRLSQFFNSISSGPKTHASMHINLKGTLHTKTGGSSTNTHNRACHENLLVQRWTDRVIPTGHLQNCKALLTADPLCLFCNLQKTRIYFLNTNTQTRPPDWRKPEKVSMIWCRELHGNQGRRIDYHPSNPP